MEIEEFGRRYSNMNHLGFEQKVMESNSKSLSNMNQMDGFNNPEAKCKSIRKTNFCFKSNVQSIKMNSKKNIDLILSDSKKTKVTKTTNVCSSKTARSQKSNFCEDFTLDQPRAQQRLIDGIIKKYKHKKYQKRDSPDEDKIATSQLLNENISHEFHCRGSVKRDKECKAISPLKFEEKLEGWIMRSTLKEKPLKKKVYENRLDNFCEQNKNQLIDLENTKNLENRVGKNKKKNCSQIMANKFLRNLQFKYSNNFKDKLIATNVTQSQSLSKIEKNKSRKDFEIEENQKLVMKSSRVHRNRYEQKRQRKKVPLTFTTIVPDIQESFKNVRIPMKKTKKVSQKGYLNVRINHDSLMSRSESQYKKATGSQRKGSEQELGCDDQFQKIRNRKLDQLERHVTIDHSELSRMIEEDQKQAKMQIRNRNINYRSAKNLENMSMKELKFKNIIEEESVKRLNRNQKKQKTKLKFKNTQNLQSAHLTPLYPISKNTQEATKIFRPDNQNKLGQHKESLVQKVIRAEKEKQKLVPWEARICERGGQSFYHLRSLIKKQFIDSVYLASQKTEQCKQ